MGLMPLEQGAMEMKHSAQSYWCILQITLNFKINVWKLEDFGSAKNKRLLFIGGGRFVCTANEEEEAAGGALGEWIRPPPWVA